MLLSDLTQEKLDELVAAKEKAETEAKNKATAISEERQAKKDAEKKAADAEAKVTEVTNQLTKATSDLGIITKERDDLKNEIGTLTPYKEQAETKAKEELDAKQKKYDDLTKKLTDNKIDFDQATLDKLGDNIDAKLLILEKLDQVSTPGFDPRSPKGGEANQGESEYEKAKKAGDIDGMIKHAPKVEESTDGAAA